MHPRRCHASTMRILCSGDTRAYTEMPGSSSSSSASPISSSSTPAIARSPGSKMPIWRAMAVAVTLWSPVIMIVRMPPSFASATALTDSGRGGSIMAASPTKVNPCSSSSVSGRAASSLRSAKASTRSPSSESRSFARRTLSFAASSMGTGPSSESSAHERSSSTSSAPLVSMVGTPSNTCSVLMSLRSESNASSLTRGCSARKDTSSMPRASPIWTSATSVGSPMEVPASSSVTASLARRPMRTSSRCGPSP